MRARRCRSVSDTEIHVTPPAGLAAGTYGVKIGNGNQLGLDRTSVSLSRYELGGAATGLTWYAFYNYWAAMNMGASLDGDTVVTGDSGITSPALIRYDASDGTWTTTPGHSVSKVILDRDATRICISGTVYDGALSRVGSIGGWGATVSPDGTRAYGYAPPSTNPAAPAMIHTFDVSGAAAAEIGTGTSLASTPGNGGVNVLTTFDGGTLFVDRPNGILVMAAP